ncbi:hypothetical protein [Colwellia sp. MB02u-14]|uniref:hypothetical protein n=1 Tax=Colwellia sp. MB02u-14 TaxID=2759815 RepID=UPI0015F3844C|nr:hypothetical protein [Colwellia sp. MB02u-14]MBA6302675.1 hypothetical protein [Colwellia sp. MB02u-14]
MLKNISLASLISCVALVCTSIGFIVGFLVKGPADDYIDTFSKERMINPIETLVAFQEMEMYSAQPYSVFKFLSDAISDYENGETEFDTPTYLALYMNLMVPDMEKYCSGFYELGKVKQDCLDSINKAKEQFSRYDPRITKRSTRTP